MNQTPAEELFREMIDKQLSTLLQTYLDSGISNEWLILILVRHAFALDPNDDNRSVKNAVKALAAALRKKSKE
jgi:hypothetical protein